MKFITVSLAAALAVSSAFAGGSIQSAEAAVEAPAPALEISANLAITSNYVWRGMTQTSNSPAVQGGIDLGYKGFYLGTWGSNVEFGNTENSLEADFYAGYAGEAYGIGYDLGIIQYAYPHDSSALNFEEVYFGLGREFGMVDLSAKYSFGLDNAPDDWEIGASTNLPADFGLEVGYGDYDTVGTRYSAALTKSVGKFDLNVAYINFSADAGSSSDEDNIVATISTSF